MSTENNKAKKELTRMQTKENMVSMLEKSGHKIQMETNGKKMRMQTKENVISMLEADGYTVTKNKG